VTSEVRAAVFRPNDERMREAVELLEALGATPVPDPMLAVEPTGATPADGGWDVDGNGSDSDGNADPAVVVFTSKTGVELAAAEGWRPRDGTTLACIGPRTAAAAREAGWTVDVVPAEYSSAGLVAALADRVAGERVAVARSDHGSPVLLDGLRDAGADVRETVLYRLVRPEGAGESAERAAAGELEAALFTSSLTVEHFLEAATERGVREAAVAGLDRAVVGVIGEPTRETAESLGVAVDVVPTEATFEALATETVEAAAPSYEN
jgi:uroporphyrinogen-III synthase